jgi:hypothetical protein
MKPAVELRQAMENQQGGRHGTICADRHPAQIRLITSWLLALHEHLTFASEDDGTMLV